MRHGENGFLFDIDSSEGLIAGIDAVMAEPAAARDMTQRGRDLVRREFDNLAVTGRVKSLYEEVVREHAQCRR
jgi:glycosyltransferase involved in cell wall biosynthesis